MLDGELDQLGKLLMVLLEEPKGPQGLDAGGGLGGIGEFASCARVLVDGDGRVGRLGRVGGCFRMVMRLMRYCQHSHVRRYRMRWNAYLDQWRSVHGGSPPAWMWVGREGYRGKGRPSMAGVFVGPLG